VNKTSYDEGLEKGLEKGHEKGLEKGHLDAHRELALMFLEERCGPVSQKLRAYIESLPMESLRTLSRKIAKATNFAEAGLAEYADS
jgi:flagellar biosynthesis/type III secretory pathway protein FliH